MITVLVTGIAGFIGSHLGEKLLADGYKVIGIDNFDPFYPAETKRNNLKQLLPQPNFKFYELELTEPDALNAISEDVDIVVHLAAKAGVRPSIDKPLDYLNVNVTATNLLLEWMKAKNIRKYVFASSSSIYGNNKSIPFKETDVVDFPISPYAYTKKACELMNYTYHHLNHIDTVNLRFFTVYGPRQRPDLAIHKFVDMIRQGKPLPLYGDGSTARDYTFVGDIVKGITGAMKYVLENEQVYEIVNLGNNEPVPLKTLVTTLFGLMGKEPAINYLPMQPGDVDITFASIDKAKKLWGYSPETTITDGLKQFITWFDNQHQQ
ncbi:MAG: GDP-mannose 4,6-dehydratase [Hymenobacteraceae bacterium]|nr:GDP-mannose 4,6-dehydratase [Hymenobacteraceae bacterium]MDX5397711.1 GDP-mannose 4,6-dehydratase [Hymenobacteraceae bacterium]MDX5513789.1 GDP-mannose 4,6-dehydratase [Hymenobacteraceae bacterium]